MLHDAIRQLAPQMAGRLLLDDPVRRTEAGDVIDAAESIFRTGADLVYLSVEEDGSVLVTAHPPDRQVFVAASSVAQIESFVAELRRRAG